MKKILFIILFLIGFITKTFSCDCDGERKPVTEILKNSKAVFIGKLVSYKQSTKSIAHGKHLETFQEIEFSVIETLSGDSSKTITFLSEDTDCGQFFEKEKEYLVYAFFDKITQSLSINICHSFCPEIESVFGKKDLEAIRKINTGKL